MDKLSDDGIDILYCMLRREINRDDITFKKVNSGVMFFIGNSSILHIMMDDKETLIHSNGIDYCDVVNRIMESFNLMCKRDDMINIVIKKES